MTSIQNIPNRNNRWSNVAGHTIQEEGVSLPKRTYLNLVGSFTASDDSSNDATKIEANFSAITVTNSAVVNCSVQAQFNYYLIDVTGHSSGVTLNLPGSAPNGVIFCFADAVGSDPISPTGLGLYSAVINPAGITTIQGYTSITLDKENDSLSLIYNTGLDRWVIIGGLTRV